MDSIKTPEELSDLLFKYMGGQLNAAETDLLKRWLEEAAGRKDLFEQRTSPLWIAGKLQVLKRVTSPDNNSKMHELLQEAMLEGSKIKQQKEATEPQLEIVVSPQHTKGGFTRHYRKYVAVAAMLFLIAASATLYFSTRKNAPVSVVKTQAVEIQPGQDGATLELSDGRILALERGHKGQLAEQGSMKIIADSGQLTYSEHGTTAHSAALQYNKLSTAKGQQFSLKLSDGSVIYLNAQSSVRFPAGFGSQDRNIDVSGEVYLEIAKDTKRPFTVNAGGHLIQVLGTSFNINAYPDESSMAVTLNEGAIKVDQTPIKRAGLQARLSDNGVIKVVPVDISEIIAWKDGLFVFRDADMRTVMRQLSRWYDMDVVFRNNVESHLNARIEKNKPITEILRLVEMTNDVHFTIEGKRVTIRQ